MEVRPIVEILAGRTVEQALIEVAQEEEMRRMRDQQRDYEESRNAELVELQRFEEQEKRLRTEKDRRMQQEEDVHRAEREAQEKIAARAFSRAYLQDLVPSVFNNLRENGYFYDPVERGSNFEVFICKSKQNCDVFRNGSVISTLVDGSNNDPSKSIKY